MSGSAGAWQSAGHSGTVRAQAPRGRWGGQQAGTGPVHKQDTTWSGLEGGAWSTAGAQEGVGRTASSEGRFRVPAHTVSCEGSLTSSYLILTREETELKVNTLENPLSWDSHPALSGSGIHALSSTQAAIRGDAHSGSQRMTFRINESLPQQSEETHSPQISHHNRLEKQR